MYKNKTDSARRHAEETPKRLWAGMVDARSTFVTLRIWMWVFVSKNAINSRGGSSEDTKALTCGSCAALWHPGTPGVLALWLYNAHWSPTWSWGTGDFHPSWWSAAPETAARSPEKRHREWNARFRKEVSTSPSHIPPFSSHLGLFFLPNPQVSHEPPPWQASGWQELLWVHRDNGSPWSGNMPILQYKLAKHTFYLKELADRLFLLALSCTRISKTAKQLMITHSVLLLCIENFVLVAPFIFHVSYEGTLTIKPWRGTKWDQALNLRVQGLCGREAVLAFLKGRQRAAPTPLSQGGFVKMMGYDGSLWKLWQDRVTDCFCSGLSKALSKYNLHAARLHGLSHGWQTPVCPR